MPSSPRSRAMTPSPRPRSDGRGRVPMSDNRDGLRTTPFQDPPRYDDDDADRYASGERDKMLPKVEFPVSRASVPGPRRFRLIGILSGLGVLLVMALLVAFHTNQTGDWSMEDEAKDTTVPTRDAHFSGLATKWHPLPTAPTQTKEPHRPVETGSVRKAIVMASYRNQKVDWLQNLPKYTKGWEIFRYVADDPGTDFLQVPNQNGREAMAFLTFIIDNYDDLPDFSVFSHGHDTAWHQPEHTIDKLMALNLTAVTEEDYVNLRCAESPGCTKNTKFYFKPRNKQDHRPGTLIEQGFWTSQMAEEFGPLPATFGRRCCAQFAVTRHAIQLRSHDFWKSLRKPLEGSIEDIKKIWGPNVDQYSLGSLYEQVWHILFGKPADFCPSKEVCRRVHFSNVIHCDGETTSFKANKDNFRKIKCTNDLRVAVDNGVPLNTVFGSGADGLVQPQDDGAVTTGSEDQPDEPDWAR